jgi:hypothetical protein
MCSGHRCCSVIGEAGAAGPAQQGVVARHGTHGEDVVCLAQVMSRHPLMHTIARQLVKRSFRTETLRVVVLSMTRVK